MCKQPCEGDLDWLCLPVYNQQPGLAMPLYTLMFTLPISWSNVHIYRRPMSWNKRIQQRSSRSTVTDRPVKTASSIAVKASQVTAMASTGIWPFLLAVTIVIPTFTLLHYRQFLFFDSGGIVNLQTWLSNHYRYLLH